MKTLTMTELKQLSLSDDELVIIDIRSPSEHAREYITGSINLPLEQLQTANTNQYQDKTLLFYCRSGNRTRHAQAQLESIPCQQGFCLGGGITAWKQNGNPVTFNKKAPLELMRQVQIIAGVLILLGLILGFFVSPYFLLLTAFVGLGLLTAGITGFCGMANLLMLLPYNQPKQNRSLD